MDKIVSLVIQFVYFLLVLVIPGGLVLACIAAVWKLLKFKPPTLPLLREDGGLYTLDQWRRDARGAHPIRWWLTETMPASVKAWWSEGDLTPQEEILRGAFGGFARWVDENPDRFADAEFAFLDGNLEVERAARFAEIASLYRWWTLERDTEISRIERLPEDEREHWQGRLEEEEQLALSRLSNVWRDLT